MQFGVKRLFSEHVELHSILKSPELLEPLRVVREKLKMKQLTFMPAGAGT